MEQSSLLRLESISGTTVSRETEAKLDLYADLLLKWQRKINLISPKTSDKIWERHFLDSAQLFYLLSDKEKPIFDFGSGAGFPGLVLSLLGASQIKLFESDSRKCVFLSEVIRQTQSTALVINKRIEAMPREQKATTITSRACASLDQLLAYAFPLLSTDGECLFLKGRGAEQEIDEARQKWMFHVEQKPSLVDEEGRVLRITALQPR